MDRILVVLASISFAVAVRPAMQCTRERELNHFYTLTTSFLVLLV